MIGFHFLILAAGELLKYKDKITPIDIQNFISEDPELGARPPLEDCRLALRLMEDVSLICSDGNETYGRGN
jgi:hypothetical protein